MIAKPYFGIGLTWITSSKIALIWVTGYAGVRQHKQKP